MTYPHELACPRCKALYPKRPDNYGSDIKCAFANPLSVFSEDNWFCATMLALRQGKVMAPECKYQEDELPDQRWNADEHAVAIPDGEGAFLIISWYKRRGRTQFARYLKDNTMRVLYLSDAERALAYAEG